MTGINMKFKRIGLVLIVMLSAACSSKKNPETTADQFVYDQLSIQAVTIKAGQDELYRAGVINRTPVRFIPQNSVLYAGKNNISLDWQGDARELLADLAKKQNKKFSTQGLSLPLPMNINVKNTTYFNLLNIIKQQIEYRADIQERGDGIQLIYTQIKNTPRGNL